MLKVAISVLLLGMTPLALSGCASFQKQSKEPQVRTTTVKPVQQRVQPKAPPVRRIVPPPEAGGGGYGGGGDGAGEWSG